MVNIVITLLITTIFMQASSFKNECMRCHEKQNIPFEMIYKRYLIKYSSKSTIKQAIFKMCKNPTIERSLVPPSFLRRYGIKQACTLNDKDLYNAIEEFINFYDIKKNIQLKYFDENF